MTRQQLILITLMEECDELSQRASKALRFGIDEVQEGQELNNAERMIYEFNDVIATMEMIFRNERQVFNQNMINKKLEKIDKWLEYSREQGILTA